MTWNFQAGNCSTLIFGRAIMVLKLGSLISPFKNTDQEFQKTQKKNERLKIELANERQIILELKAKMSDVGEVRSSNMELIDQLQKAKAAIEKLSAIRDRQKTQIDVSLGNTSQHHSITRGRLFYSFVKELKAELKLCSHAATDDRETLQTQLLSLTSDLKTTKMALDETIKREKQVRILLRPIRENAICKQY